MRLVGAINPLSPVTLAMAGLLLAIICLLPIWVRRNMRRGAAVLALISMVLGYAAFDSDPPFYEFTDPQLVVKEITFALMMISLAGILMARREFVIWIWLLVAVSTSVRLALWWLYDDSPWSTPSFGMLMLASVALGIAIWAWLLLDAVEATPAGGFGKAGLEALHRDAAMSGQELEKVRAMISSRSASEHRK